MSLHFVLDGYNVIKQTGFLDDLEFAAGREKLVRLIESRQPQGSSRNTLTIVFDGRPGIVSPQSSTVKLVFTYEESADEWIKRLAEESSNPKNMVVVTNDRELQRHVKALGVTIWAVEDFIAKLSPGTGKQKKSSFSGRREGKLISKTTEHKINTELENIWLRKSKD